MVHRGVIPLVFEEWRVTIVLSSSVLGDELTQTLQSILAHPDFVRGSDVVFDVRGSDVNPNLSDIKQMLTSLQDFSSEFSGCFAVVVSDALRYGLARMASSLAAPLGMKMNAFYSPEDAHKWLLDERNAVAQGPKPSHR